MFDHKVTESREEMKVTYQALEKYWKSDRLKEEYCQKKENLYSVYTMIEKEEQNNKIKEDHEAHVNQRHAKSWKLINEISSTKFIPIS